MWEEEKEVQWHINKELYNNFDENKKNNELYDIKDYIYNDKITDNELWHKLFGCISCMQDFYDMNMDNEEDWSKRGPGIREKLKNQKDLEAKIRHNLYLYVKRIVLGFYPNNILDDDFIKNITPRMIKWLIYYWNWLEFLWETHIDDNSTEEKEIQTEKDQNTYPMIYHIGEEIASDLWLEKSEIKEIVAQANSIKQQQKWEVDIIGNEIIKDFLMACIDKILIAELRHNKTDYDKCDFLSDDDEDNEYFNRRYWRKYYNSYCRDKYLFNQYYIEKDKEWNIWHLTSVYHYDLDDTKFFWENTTTWTFDFFYDNYELQEEEQHEHKEISVS